MPDGPRGTLFVTGTDTGVGKTRVACALLHAWRARGVDVCGFKPVATGCASTPDGLRNDDVLALEDAARSGEPYAELNPYAFAPAIAPHLAARASGARISLPKLDRAHDELAARHAMIVAEGAGGWRVPLDEVWTLGEWVVEREWPVVLVVAMRLGCLNHALLSAEVIGRRARLAGWVANRLPPAMEFCDENIAALEQRLAAPLLGVVGAGASVEQAAACLDLEPLERALRPVREVDLPD
jgi:dethiobiotin synthetase